jgi:hypothetical protein
MRPRLTLGVNRMGRRWGEALREGAGKPKDMTDFIDLRGASGASYRFRVWPEGMFHPRIGGNFLYVRQEAERMTVCRIGETDDLSQARIGWESAQKKGATHVYTRLNVSEQVRVAEHRDLASSHRRSRTAATHASEPYDV